MRRILAFLLLPVLPVLFILFFPFLLVSPAAGQEQTIDDVVAALELRSYFIENGAEGDVNAMELIVADTLNTDENWYFVSLAEDFSQGNDLLAEQLQQRLSAPGTILVVSPGEVAAVSTTRGNPDVNAATAVDDCSAGESFATCSAGFYEQLSSRSVDLGAAAPSNDDAAGAVGGGGDDDGGGGGSGWFWVILLGIIGAIGGLLWRASRKQKKVDNKDVEAARDEIRAQLQEIANQILEDADKINVSGDERAIEYFRQANDTYQAATEEVEQTTNLLELAQLDDRVEIARWHMRAAEAIVDGEPIPPEPVPERPVACFFDPTHRPGSEEARIETEAGDKDVKVCKVCAGKLRRGERPEPREITVGGRKVPAATAPRSHGGIGMGGLTDFAIILGGLAKGIGYSWGRGGRQQPSRRAPSGRSVTRSSSGSSRSGIPNLADIFGPDTLPRGSNRRGGGSRRSIGRSRRRR